jgi:hypothetical protein
MKYIDNRIDTPHDDDRKEYFDDMTEQEYQYEDDRYEQMMEDEAVARYEFENSIWNNP